MNTIELYRVSIYNRYTLYIIMHIYIKTSQKRIQHECIDMWINIYICTHTCVFSCYWTFIYSWCKCVWLLRTKEICERLWLCFGNARERLLHGGHFSFGHFRLLLGFWMFCVQLLWLLCTECMDTTQLAYGYVGATTGGTATWYKTR